MLCRAPAVGSKGTKSILETSFLGERKIWTILILIGEYLRHIRHLNPWNFTRKSSLEEIIRTEEKNKIVAGRTLNFLCSFKVLMCNERDSLDFRQIIQIFHHATTNLQDTNITECYR
ncbi:unnamed protein product [Allacma fusca]|uniref:Uncharacterized protein n=1 Tax=Allacma fusca TaxID=39272 RepID=A0A8J2KNL7_9HEXA|nr:unnamed protein product [Allacma fusca]